MTSYKKIQPTYRELAKALSLLRLKEMSNERVFVFKDSKEEVVVQLPNGSPDTNVHMARFIALSYNLADLGIIAQAHDLGRMVEKMRLAEQQPAS